MLIKSYNNGVVHLVHYIITLLCTFKFYTYNAHLSNILDNSSLSAKHTSRFCEYFLFSQVSLRDISHYFTKVKKMKTIINNRQALLKM